MQRKRGRTTPVFFELRSRITLQKTAIIMQKKALSLTQQAVYYCKRYKNGQKQIQKKAKLPQLSKVLLLKLFWALFCDAFVIPIFFCIYYKHLVQFRPQCPLILWSHTCLDTVDKTLVDCILTQQKWLKEALERGNYFLLFSSMSNLQRIPQKWGGKWQQQFLVAANSK